MEQAFWEAVDRTGETRCELRGPAFPLLVVDSCAAGSCFFQGGSLRLVREIDGP